MRKGSVIFGVVLMAAALLFLTALPVEAQGGPLYENFVSLSELHIPSGQSFAMPVTLTNDNGLVQVTVPLQIRQVDFITIDSVSFAGGRLDGLGVTTATIDNGNHTVILDFAMFTKDAKPLAYVPSGSGLMANIFMTVAPHVPPTDVAVDTTNQFLSYSYQLIDTAGVNVEDYFAAGLIHVLSMGPVIHLEPSTFNFTAIVGNNPDPDTLHITNLGVDPLNWHITHQPAWLNLSALSGTAPSDVGVQPEVAAFPVGELHDSIAVTDTFAVPKTVWAYVNVKIRDIPEPNVAGFVFDTLGTAIEGAAVELWDSYPGGSLLFNTTSGIHGEFSFSLVPDGDYDLHCTKAGYFPKTQPITAPDNSIIVTLIPEGAITECIPLHTGWNLISWNVDTPDDNIESIIANIKGCVDVILGFEQGGATYDPYLPQFSTLDILDHLHGYWFRMLCDTTLCVTGDPVASGTPIDLEANWNLVSYLPDLAQVTPSAIGSVLDQLVVALGFDNGALSYDPAHPDLATLTDMGPNFGYWLKTNAPATLIYPTPVLKARLAVATPGSMRSYPPAAGVTPTREWVDLFGEGITLDGKLIPEGTILAAYDENGHLCGQATVGAAGRLTFTPVYGDDQSTAGVEGPNPGGTINLTLDGAPIQESYTYSSFGDRIRLTSLTSLGKTANAVPRTFTLAQNYPNPFNPTTAIKFSLPTMSLATLEIFNVVGERVSLLLDRYLPAGAYSVIWDGTDAGGKPTASGMYFYRLRAGDYTDTKKMMLVK